MKSQIEEEHTSQSPSKRDGDSTDIQNHSLGESSEQQNPLLSFFIPSLKMGGAEQVATNLINGLSDRGYNVELLLSQSGSELQSQLSDEVEVVKLGPTRTPVFGIAMHIPALAAYLRRKEPAALFSHMAHVSVVCLATKRLGNLDTAIVPIHHTGYQPSKRRSLKTRIVKRMIRKLYPSADQVIAVSEGVANGIVEQTNLARDDISVLYNPIDVEYIRQCCRESVDHRWLEDDDLEVILFVGRIEQQKDLETWLRTFKLIHERNPNTRGVIAGQGSQRENLQELAGRLGVDDVVSIPGYVENAYGYMHRADVFFLSSRYEGLPTVLIESLACGCPIVATDCPSGPREILADGQYGHLAPVGDTQKLADAVVDMLNDPTPADELTARAQDFSTESTLDDYESFIEEYIITE